MIWRIAVILSTLVFAFAILFTSVLKTASVHYVFSQNGNGEVISQDINGSEVEIDYHLPFPGRILPDHFLWPLKALRDKAWLLLTRDAGKKADLKLLFADKRLVSAQMLFDRQKPGIAFATLIKSEMYLREASETEQKNREDGLETKEFLVRLTNASLKHRLVIDKILVVAPEDARPGIIKAQDTAREVYNLSRDTLQGKGMEVPQNPFNGD